MAETTQKTDHTPEPWLYHRYNHNDFSIEKDEAGLVANIADLKDNSPLVNEANARRIVACVNYCAGISTEELESGNLLPLRDLISEVTK